MKSQEFYAGASGGWGLVPYVPVPTMRVELSAAATATTSFVIVEAAQG